MTERRITPAPVRKTVQVAVPPAQAFAVFTEGIGSWWPATHHVGASPLDQMVIEPRQGGRWFGRCVDGTECAVGSVLHWQPPSRLVLAWQLGAEWKYDPAFVTEVEVNFIPDGDGVTRVELEHRSLDRYGDRAVALREKFEDPGGWAGLLTLFAEATLFGQRIKG